MSGQIIDAVNNFVSEIVKGSNDLFNDVLAGEVLVTGKWDQSLDHGSESTSAVNFSFNLLEGVLEFLDLHQWWVR